MTGLLTLCAAVMRVHLKKSKRITTSNWERNELSSQQIAYAATDAWASYELAVQLLAPVVARAS
jgi:ribonuclease D